MATVPVQPEESDRPPLDVNLDRLLIEYEQCNAGYNNRDFMGEDEFTKIIQAFFVFLSLLLAVNVVTSSANPIRILLSSILGVVGVVSFLSLLIDLEGTLGCRMVLRVRAREIEKILSDYKSPRIWREMDLRKFKFEERLTKNLDARRRRVERETEGELYIWASRIILVTWVVVVITVVVTHVSYSISIG